MADPQTNPAPSTVLLEFVDADPQNPDPATRGDVAREVLDALRQEGRSAEPVYTGLMGADLFAVGLLLAGQWVMANKDLVIELVKLARTVFESAVKQSEKWVGAKSAREQVKLTITLDDVVITLETPMSGAWSAVEVAERVIAQYPQVVRGSLARDRVRLRASVPALPSKRRR